MVDLLIQSLQENGIPYERLDIGGGWEILVSQHGGHVYGPFREDCPEGIFWYPKDIEDPQKLRELVHARKWNTGGDRVWISP